MTLKTATLIAIIGFLIDSVLWLLAVYEVYKLDYQSTAYYAVSILRLVVTNGSLILFLLMLYLRQKQASEG
jgi:hypothetical protein